MKNTGSQLEEEMIFILSAPPFGAASFILLKDCSLQEQ